MTKMRAASPEVATEIATRYATAKIYTTDSVRHAWPILRDEVGRHGSDADVRGLALDAKAEARPALRWQTHRGSLSVVVLSAPSVPGLAFFLFGQ
jgi:hypothetical protein